MTTLRQQDGTVTNTPPPPHPRQWLRLVWLGLAVVVVVGAVTTAFLLGRSGATQSTDPTPTPTAGPFPTAVVTDAAGQDGAAAPLPDGCLGGPDPYSAILPAQAAASLDAVGAAEFARSAFRYLMKSYPQPGDFAAVLPQVFMDPGPRLEQSSAPASQPAPAGTMTRYVRSNETTFQSTVSGDNADVTVNLFTELVYPDGTSNTVLLTQRFLLTAVDGRWMIADTPPTDPLPAVGTAGVSYFFSGC